MQNDIEIFILAGGKGTRLREIVSEVPKPMAPIANKPFLDWLINKIKKQGFSKLMLLTGYMSNVIEKHFEDGKNFGLTITYSVEKEPLGTGGALKLGLIKSLSKKILLLNGDTFFDIDYNEFISRCNHKSLVNICLTKVDDISRYGAVITDSQGRVEKFLEKSDSCGAGNINAGIYLIDKSLLDNIPDGCFSFETNILPQLINSNEVYAFSMEGDFIDIGVPSDYERAQSLIPNLR